jgi:hypothetical protein
LTGELTLAPVQRPSRTRRGSARIAAELTSLGLGRKVPRGNAAECAHRLLFRSEFRSTHGAGAPSDRVRLVDTVSDLRTCTTTLSRMTVHVLPMSVCSSPEHTRLRFSDA